MLNPFDSESFSRDQIIHALTHLRLEWQEANSGSLLDTQASVGLMLADLVRAIGMNNDEQIEALGDDLYRELNDVFQPA